MHRIREVLVHQTPEKSRLLTRESALGGREPASILPVHASIISQHVPVKSNNGFYQPRFFMSLFSIPQNLAYPASKAIFGLGSKPRTE